MKENREQGRQIASLAKSYAAERRSGIIQMVRIEQLPEHESLERACAEKRPTAER